MLWELAAAAALGYVVGSIPVGLWLVLRLRRIDVRSVGSGNLGATNVWRAVGPRYGIAVALADVLKGFGPALAAAAWFSVTAGVVAGAAAMLGHARPLFLRFGKGGKSVATCGGAFIALAPTVAAIAVAVWLLVFVCLRYASVASLLAAVSLPVGAIAFGAPTAVVVFAAAAAFAVVVLHRANIGRLFRGTENRFQFRRVPSRV